MTPLPPEFLTRLEAILPAADLAPTLATFAQEKPTTFRINPLKTDPAAVEEELTAAGFTLTPIEWYTGAFSLPNEQRRALTESPLFYDGRIYIQNLSSMLAPLVLAPRPGEEVLDLAAAPGGKTLQLAGMMHNEGYVAAVEPIKERFYKLKHNLLTAGAEVVKTYMMDGRAAGRRWPQVFDKVLLDAPCSSEARFTQLDPQSWAHWQPRKIKETSHKQKKLLQAALYALRPGGIMVYCTCAFAPEENELVVQSQLEHFEGEVEVVPLELPIPNTRPGLTTWAGKSLLPECALTLRVLPTAHMDAFFLCKLHKKG